jgi:hypothetical protein
MEQAFALVAVIEIASPMDDPAKCGRRLPLLDAR